MLLKDTPVVEAGSSLADFTRPALIVPELRERDSAGAVMELSQILHQQGCVPDFLSFFHAAMNHEFLVNSATGAGIAFPHARLHGVVRSSFAFGRSPEVFPWNGRSSPPVRFVFLLAVPATDAAGYLQLLSALARFGREEPFLTRLGSQDSPEAIFELFRHIKVRHG